MALTRSERKRLLTCALVALAAGASLVAAFWLGLLRTTDSRATDALFALRPAQVARSTRRITRGAHAPPRST